jgi:hypothetical protein
VNTTTAQAEIPLGDLRSNRLGVLLRSYQSIPPLPALLLCLFMNVSCVRHAPWLPLDGSVFTPDGAQFQARPPAQNQPNFGGGGKMMIGGMSSS